MNEDVLERWLRAAERSGEAGAATEAPRVIAVTEAVDHSTTQYILGAIGDLTAWVLGGLLLFWALRVVVLLVEMSPLAPRTKGGILRFAPVVEMVVLVAYVASALVELIAEEPEFAWVLIALVVTLVVFSWSALYDLALGVAFRVARVCQVGDIVQVDDIEGRVLEVGVRALVVQTRDGDEAVVPYGRIGRRTLRRTQSVSGAYVHSFLLDERADADFAELRKTVVEAAMRSHWASAVHEAKVERRANGAVEVSVFAHDADHAPIVEMDVRRALGEVPAEGTGVGRVLGELPRRLSPAPARPPGPTEPVARPGSTGSSDGGRAGGGGGGGGMAREKDQGAPQAEVGEETSDVMDLRTVLGPKLPPPPSWEGDGE